MLFNPEINSIEEDILYHETQIKEAQERLDQVQVSQAYSDTVISSLEDFFENTDPFMFEILKGHIDQMFEENKVTYNNDLKEVKPSSVPCTVNKVEEIKPPVTLSQPQKEFGTLSYYELTGRPDVRPDTYEDLAPNVVYSSSGRAYVGFNDKQEAEKFSNRISEPSMIGDTDTMNGYRYEVKFYCTREYIEELLHQLHNDDFVQDEDWTEKQKKELDWQEQLIRIASDIFYDPSTSKCYLGFSNYQRATTYGAHLKEIHELFDSKYTVDKPKVVTNCKHELTISAISRENALKLAKLNLKKKLDHKANKAITDTWKVEEVLTENVQIYVPHIPKPSTKKSKELTEKDFPSYPYPEIPLTEVEFGDVITSTPHSRSAYMVKEHKGEFVIAECLYHKSLSARVGEEYSFSKIYLVEKASSATKESASTETERSEENTGATVIV